MLDVSEVATTSVDAREVDAKQPVELAPGAHVVKIRLGVSYKTAVEQAKRRPNSEKVECPAGHSEQLAWRPCARMRRARHDEALFSARSNRRRGARS